MEVRVWQDPIISEVDRMFLELLLLSNLHLLNGSGFDVSFYVFWGGLIDYLVASMELVKESTISSIRHSL